jgi:hypothetical protein
MIKTFLAGLLLFVVMVTTAVTVSHTALQNNTAAAAFSEPYTGSILQSAIPGEATHDPSDGGGRGGGLESNPFIIALGLTLIICVAIGFWKHHQIHEERNQATAAEEAAKLKATRFKPPVRKEARK